MSASPVNVQDLTKAIKRGRSYIWHDVISGNLPEMGERVHVRGIYTRQNYNWPIAYRVIDKTTSSGWSWESNDWRGRVFIWEWSEIPKVTI